MTGEERGELLTDIRGGMVGRMQRRPCLLRIESYDGFRGDLMPVLGIELGVAVEFKQHVPAYVATQLIDAAHVDADHEGAEVAQIPEIPKLDQDGLVLQGQPQVMDGQADALVFDDHLDEPEVVVLPKYRSPDQTVRVDIQLFAELERKAFVLGEFARMPEQNDELIDGQPFRSVRELRGVNSRAIEQCRRSDAVLFHETQEVRYVPRGQNRHVIGLSVVIRPNGRIHGWIPPISSLSR